LEARVALGRVMQWEGRAVEAVRELQAVLRQDSAHVEARWQLAVAMHALGDCGGALVHYRALIAGQTRHVHLYTRVATCLLQTAQKMGGVGAGAAAEAAGPGAGAEAAGAAAAAGTGVGETAAGVASASKENNAAAVSEAEAMLRLAVQADPLSGEAWTLLGRTRLFQARPAAAADDLRAARRLRPTDPAVAFHLAVALQASDRCAEATALYEEAAASNATATATAAATAPGNTKGGDGNAAVTASTTPAAPRREALFRAAVCHQELGDAGLAASRYADVLVEDPMYAPAHVNWGLALKSVGRLDLAEEHYSAAVAMDPAGPGRCCPPRGSWIECQRLMWRPVSARP
jgi:tetratricopeptide (TPR) repeat protein